MTVRSVYGNPHLVSDQLVQQYFDLLLRTGNRVANNKILMGLGQEDFSAEIKNINVPTLIQWGGDDQWIFPHYGEQFHQAIKNSSFIIYPGIGHIPMEEAPAETLKDLKTFLSQR